jgi:TRAP-type C4-dicarboxylate transport system substrate-binding protein
MMKKRLCRLMGTSLAIGCLGLTLIFASGANAETIKLKASTIFPMKHPLVVDAFNLLDKEIAKRTNGRVKITWYHASTLVKAHQAYDALKSGVVDMAFIPISGMPQYFPVSVGYGLPFMSDSPRHSVEMGLRMYEEIPQMKQEWSKVKLLGLSSSDVCNLALREKDVKTLEDLQGLRIGTVWATVLKIVKLLPCAAVQMTPEDTYMSLQRKMADGVLVPNAALWPWKITEVAKHHTIGNFAVMPTAWAMSKQAYEKKLPPDLRQVFDDINPSFARLFGLTSHTTGQWVLGALKKRGDSFHYLSPEAVSKWKQTMQPLYNEYIKTLNDRGYDGQEIFNKLQAISTDTKNNPYDKIDEWWKQGRMGKPKPK